MTELPRYDAGPAGGRRALLVHGLSSDARGWWQVAEHLEALGWRTTAVDLRGHGAAPRADSYDIPEYAADLLHVWPGAPGQAWDAVIAHSLGACSSLVAAAAEPGWTRRLVLIDPVLGADGRGLARIRDSILKDKRHATRESLTSGHPRWDARDVQAKLDALDCVEEGTITASVASPAHWQLVDEAQGLSMPTLIVAADPELGALARPDDVQDVTGANPQVTAVTVEGAGHSIHRDDPAALFAPLDPFLQG
ncbi:MAG TPA: alpha/beta hydrolase [Naasia sp.]|jgi:pimeloyl-ACP methyl ester carboxylesterase